jgi:hypothetical protein
MDHVVSLTVRPPLTHPSQRLPVPLTGAVLDCRCRVTPAKPIPVQLRLERCMACRTSVQGEAVHAARCTTVRTAPAGRGDPHLVERNGRLCRRHGADPSARPARLEWHPAHDRLVHAGLAEPARRTPCAAIPPLATDRPSGDLQPSTVRVRVCVQPRGVPGIPPGQLPDTPPFANSTTARAAATGGLDLRSVGRRATHARCAQTWRHAPQRRPSRRAQMPRRVSGLHGACVWQDAALTVFMPTDAAWLALCKGKQMMVDFLTGSAALRPTPNRTFPAPPRHPKSTQTHSRTAQPHWLAQAQRIRRTRSECPHACLCLPACTRFGLR